MSKETKFYKFKQNNSGGHFVVDNKVCNRVIIEAHSAKEANDLAENLGIYFNGVADNFDCSCCGDRWYKVDESDELKFPIQYSNNLTFNDVKKYAQHVANEYGWTEPDVRIYYLYSNKVDEFYCENKNKKRGNLSK